MSELPELKKIYEKYRDKGFDIIGFSCDYRREDVGEIRPGTFHSLGDRLRRQRPQPHGRVLRHSDHPHHDLAR